MSDRSPPGRSGRAGRPGLLAAACVVLAAALPPGAAAQAPDGEWRTLTTPHFRVTYPADLPDLGRRAARQAEAAYDALAGAFVSPPEGSIDLVVTDHSDVANGFASVFPTNRIVIHAPPPTDGLSLSYFDQWLELVIVHELAHVYQLDMTGALGSVARAVFGRPPFPWPVFPGLGTPRWVREGLATWYESDLTHAGRTRGSYHEMVIRTAIVEGAFEELDQMSGDSPVWPDGNRPYVYGSQFFDWLLEEHGEERMAAFARNVAGQWVPYRMNDAAEDAFGESFGDAWGRWKEALETEARALRDSLSARRPLTRPRRLSGGGRLAIQPRPSPDGRWLAFGRSDGRSDAQIRLTALDGSGGRKLARTNSVSYLSWAPDGDVVFSQLEFADRYRLRGDLYRADLDGGVRRLTRGARLDQPDVAPDGSRAVAVQEGQGTNRLVEVDLETGRVRPLTPLDSAVHWAFPRISPDGRWIAVSRWESGGYFDVMILDRQGRSVQRVTRDRAVDLAPAWSPDGGWLVWASDRSGIWNVLAAPVPAGGPPAGAARQLTNVVTGVAYPAVGPAGEWLYVSGYHADGWHVERVPFRPDEGFEPFPLDPRFRTAGTTVAGSGSRVAGGGRSDAPAPSAPSPSSPESGARLPADTAEAPYSAIPSVLPHYWAPSWVPGQDVLVDREGVPRRRVEVVRSGWGVSTSGVDLLGRHAFSAGGTVSTGSGRFQGGFAYRYAGLGNPVLGASISQVHDVEPRSLTGRLEDGGLRTLFLVERERRVSLGATLVRRRYRSTLALDLTGSRIREHLELLGPDLRESRDFRLQLPDRTQWEGRLTLSGSHTRRHPFSISREDGVSAALQLRVRAETSLPDSLAGNPAVDRSFRDAIGRIRLYKAIPGPGFANHVLALRATGGVAGGAGADGFHFEVGGASGRPEPISGFGLFGGSSVRFPVRGFEEGDRFGRYAWSASAEYRFPLILAHEGLGMAPLHLDRIWGSFFGDAGNAWGPELGGESIRFQNPRPGSLASAGGEVAVSLLPFWTSTVTLRTGLAFALRGGEGSTWYVRVGTSF